MVGTTQETTDLLAPRATQVDPPPPPPLPSLAAAVPAPLGWPSSSIGAGLPHSKMDCPGYPTDKSHSRHHHNTKALNESRNQYG